ncbi:MAG: RidA family protein [Gemmatimonadaceae bacterium]
MRAALVFAAAVAMTAELNAQVRRLNPTSLSTPTGYTHVTVGPDGRTVHIAGQVAADRTGQVVGVGDFRAQVERSFDNVRLALESVGATFDDVLKMTTYVIDLSQLAVFREVRNRVLRADQLPANTLVQVTALARPEFLIEIEAVAMLRAPLR